MADNGSMGSQRSLAFTDASLNYTIDDLDLVAGWLQGVSPAKLYKQRDERDRQQAKEMDSNHKVSAKVNGNSSSYLKRTLGSSISTLNRKLNYDEDENKERGNWTGRLDFVLSMLGYAVGLGNIWRFPYLCFRNGGGAFLLPYLLMLLMVGLPLFYLEVCLGQYCSRGPAKCWDFAPLFKGIGVAMVVASLLISIYYNMIIAWSQFYFFASFTDSLPWTGCNNPEWNTPNCSLKWPLVDCPDGVRQPNGTCYSDNKFVGVWNSTLFSNKTGIQRTWPSEEYWVNNVLGQGEDQNIYNLGAPRWHLALSLFLAWIITFLCLLKGIKTTGRVVYFTALFPYVVLLILFFRGVTLENAGKGISFYIIPDFERLGSAQVWRDAANQIFYSLGPAWGGLITLSSYNRFHNNALRDSMIVGISNAMTSLFGGFVIFSYLGYMADQLKEDVEDVVKSGPGLAFIVYPEAVSRLPAPPFWSILFFFMLILLGLDSQFATVETVLTGLLDQWPQHRHRKTWIILIICIVLFLLGLPLTTKGGAYMLNLMDAYSASWSLMLIGLTETLAISWVYGCNRFFQDMQLMFGSRPSIWWKICWMGLSPLIILFILLFACIDYSPAKYGDYVYPPEAEALGWLMALASMVWIPACAIYKLAKEDEGKTFLQKLKLQTLPNKYWGPALVKHRKLVDYVEDFVLDPEGDKRELQYCNQGFAYSNSGYTHDDNISTRTREISITTPTIGEDRAYPSMISLETSL